MFVRRYITTAIDYPNAPPHMGHVLEKVLADSIARWWRLNGDDVRFQIGTDEHGVKIQQTADREKLSPQTLVDRNVPLFRDLYDRLHISYDCFIRTTDQTAHWPTALELWKRLQNGGALEKRTYTGLYCSGCEKFMTKKDIIDGKCPDHQKAPENVSEENWFFLLKREEGWLRELLTSDDGYRIIPTSRSQETLSLMDRGLEDVSFSRPNSSLSWGIPVPGDPGQTMYVWCDALTNYLSGLGYFTDHEEGEWWNNAEVTHVIGKDIARFHALIWPAMLKHAGLPVPPPHRLLIHGFITSEGQKMSKSIGNVVDPIEVIEKYGVDALRFYLLHEIPVGNDGDFSWKRFGEVYKSKLADQIGNLLNRVLVLFRKDGQELADGWPQQCLDTTTESNWQHYEKFFETFELDWSLKAALNIVEMCNMQMQEQQVWAKPSHERVEYLTEFAEAMRHVSLMLLPFIPETAQKMSKQLGVPYADDMLNRMFTIKPTYKQWGGCTDWKRVGEPAILFPKVD